MKKTVAILLAILMIAALTLTACQKEEENAPAETKENVASESESKTETAAPESKEPETEPAKEQAEETPAQQEETSPKTLTEITLKETPNIAVEEMNFINWSDLGLVFVLHYSDGTTEEVTPDYQNYMFLFSTDGYEPYCEEGQAATEKELTLFWSDDRNLQVKLPYTVYDTELLEPTSLRVDTSSLVLTLPVGTDFDYWLISCYSTYDELPGKEFGCYEFEVNTDEVDSTKAGTYPVTVTAGPQTETFDVTYVDVSDYDFLGIRIAEDSVHSTTFYELEDIDTSGLKLELVFQGKAPANDELVFEFTGYFDE